MKSVDSPVRTSTASFARRAQDLVASVAADGWGGIAPSAYETARIVSLAPHRPGHRERVRFLLDRQNDDGSWDEIDLFRVVPTLSAVESLLTCLRRDDPNQSTEDSAEITQAARRGLQSALSMLQDGRSLPDTAAVDVIAPGLVVDINELMHSSHLHARLSIPVDLKMPFPQGVDPDKVLRLRQLARTGAELPEKTWYMLEAIGPAARGMRGVPSASGNVSASPAATAAWLPVTATSSHPCVRYLTQVQARYEQAVPVATPVDVFERSWVLGSLLRAGVPVSPDPQMLRRLAAVIGPRGTGTGTGLPVDSDTTSGAIYALTKLGMTVDADCLLTYDTGTYLRTYHIERNASSTANAHALEAFDAVIAHNPGLLERYSAVCQRLTNYLAETQQPDGHWEDKWHASPFYATFCCVTALRTTSATSHTGADVAVRRAVDWVLATQRTDGGWGWWGSTAEETAYALQTLLGEVPHPLSAAIDEAVVRGAALLTADAALPWAPALWVAKDLYSCDRVVEAAVLAATHLAGLPLSR